MMLDLEPVRGVVAVREQPVHRPREGRDPPHPPEHGRRPRTWASIQADARKVKQIVYNLLSNAVKFTVEGGQVTLRATPRPARRGRPARRAPGMGRSFPLRRQRFRGVSRDQRHRQRHRHLAGGARAPLQAVQPDRQRPGAEVRGHRPRAGHGQAPRRAARRRGRGGERRGRGLLLHGLAAAPGAGRQRRSSQRQGAGRAPGSMRRRARPPRWWWKTTSSPRS